MGFGIAAPSMAEASIKSKGRLFPLGWYRILRSIYKNDTLELLLVAVRKDYQNKGVNSILISDMYKSAVEFGIKLAETGLSWSLTSRCSRSGSGLRLESISVGAAMLKL